MFLQLTQHIPLLLLITRRFARFLLSLVIHHFFHHPSRFAVEVAQFAVFGLDQGGVDFVRGGGDDGGPPVEFVGFVNVEGYFFAVAAARGRGRGRGRGGGG